eukprot:2604812-Prymnesium_polylepis.2
MYSRRSRQALDWQALEEAHCGPALRSAPGSRLFCFHAQDAQSDHTQQALRVDRRPRQVPSRQPRQPAHSPPSPWPSASIEPDRGVQYRCAAAKRSQHSSFSRGAPTQGQGADMSRLRVR